jgi:hypothetical protein
VAQVVEFPGYAPRVKGVMGNLSTSTLPLAEPTRCIQTSTDFVSVEAASAPAVLLPFPVTSDEPQAGMLCGNLNSSSGS